MQNINIESIGTFSGGEYGTINIDGSAKSHGALVCESISVDGAFHCGGSLSATTASADGSMSVDGDIIADTLSVDGSLSVHGDLHTEKLCIDGSAAVQGKLQTKILSVDGSLSAKSDLQAENISVDGALKCASLRAERFECDGDADVGEGFYAARVEVDGTLRAAGNLEAERLHADGCISAKGQISADRIEIFGTVQADEIVGDYIHLELDSRLFRRTRKLLDNLFSREKPEMHICANLIEATTVELFDLCAGVVSGENVTIGENCRIDRLDCTGAYTIDPSSTVRILNGEPYEANIN